MIVTMTAQVPTLRVHNAFTICRLTAAFKLHGAAVWCWLRVSAYNLFTVPAYRVDTLRLGVGEVVDGL